MPSTSPVRMKVTPRFFVVLAVFMLTVYLVFGYAQGFLRIRALRSEIERVERDIAELERRNEELRERITLYDSDAFVERTAREELGLVGPGEIPVFVIDEPTEVYGHSFDDID